MKLQLIDYEGNIVTEYDLGHNEGEWDIYSPDEADMIIADICKHVDA